MTVVMTKPAIKLRRLMGVALGPTNTLAHRQTAKLTLNVRFGSKADIALSPGHVRFTPKSGHC
jgi:hypothetical protein